MQPTPRQAPHGMAGKRAGQMVDVAKLNVQLFDLSGEYNDVLRQLGEVMYQTHKGESQDEEKIAACSPRPTSSPERSPSSESASLPCASPAPAPTAARCAARTTSSAAGAAEACKEAAMSYTIEHYRASADFLRARLGQFCP